MLRRRVHPVIPPPPTLSNRLAGWFCVLIVGITGVYRASAIQPQSAQAPPELNQTQTPEPTPEELQASLESDLDRLVRRLYLASADESRIETLVSLLSDPSLPVVRSALDLALREQAGGRRLDDSLVEAVLDLLGHADASIRARSAGLADLIATPKAGEKILGQLRNETDPAVAEVLLRAAARWPESLDPQWVLKWARPDAPMPAGQARTLAELYRVGKLDDLGSIRDVLASIRLVRDSELSLPMCRLMAQVGDAPEHARLSAMLAATDAGVRRRAAYALAEVPGLSSIVLRAALEDDALTEPAVLATRSLPPESALHTLLMLPVSQNKAASDQIRVLSARLPVATVVAMFDPSLAATRRIDLLESLQLRHVESKTRGRGLVLLAEALAQREDAGAASDAAALAETMLAGDAAWTERAKQIREVDEVSESETPAAEPAAAPTDPP